MTGPIAGLRIVRVAHAELPDAHFDAIAALCARAYDEDLRETLAAFDDATHLLGWEGASLVSHLCWVPRTLAYGGPPTSWSPDRRSRSANVSSDALAVPTAYVEMVATEPARQGLGFATALLRTAAVEIASEPAFALGVLSPSDAGFYARVGWESWRGPLFEADPGGAVSASVGEEIMILRLPATPSAIGDLDLARPLTAPWREGEVW